MVKKNYFDILTEAVNDIEEHGYDSAERVAYWAEQLRKTAEASMGPIRRMEQMLRDAYEDIYRRLIERGGLAKMHPGVERYTLQRVAPHLRAELDRRILASADLIKLNREQAIAKTLQRFRGWSTSIPAGGTDAPGKGKAKADIRKAMASLPFEERRVLIDQGHKLTAALSDIVAKDQNAIAAEWQSHWRQANYNYRPDHKARDGKIYALRGNWAIEKGLMSKGKQPYYDEITAAAEEPFCRCSIKWIYNLRQLPPEMLTKKGADALKAARAKVRADSTEPLDGIALELAKTIDPLHYSRGLRSVRVVPDHDEWHAQYDSEKNRVSVQQKLLQLSSDEQVHVLLHEFGHRGQDADSETYEEFKREHLNRLPLFLDIANPVHVQDFQKTGKVASVASEVFAESYARAALGLELPVELALFWQKRFAQ